MSATSKKTSQDGEEQDLSPFWIILSRFDRCPLGEDLQPGCPKCDSCLECAERISSNQIRCKAARNDLFLLDDTAPALGVCGVCRNSKYLLDSWSSCRTCSRFPLGKTKGRKS